MTELFERQSKIRSILAEKHIVVGAGSGVVGKTTVTTSMAVQAAQSGRRVVCVTMDPAERLAGILGVPLNASDGKIQDVTKSLGLSPSSDGQLSICMLDPKKTFATLIRTRASSPQAAKRILRNKLYTYLSSSLSGIQEYMVLEQLYKLQSDPSIDLIVLDTPAATNAADFFTSPKRIKSVLDGKVVNLLRRAGEGKGRPKLLGRWPSSLLKVLSRFTGADLMDEIMQFVDALSDLFEGFSKRVKAVEKVLHGDDVALCLVTTPDQATLQDIKAFRKQLSRMNLVVDVIILNRAHWPKADKPPRKLLSRKAAAQAKQLRDIWNASYDRERALVNQVQEAWAGPDGITSIPILPEGAIHIDSLNKVAQHF
ncbi:MAG: ArsA family ATPase [Proteobacteria bacterium]|nr:ArsA family ATPase [Pseudomonadota bacterium]